MFRCLFQIRVSIKLFVQVVVAGKQWHTMWEDGQSGIYKLNAASSVQVKRKHELLDSDSMQLVDGLEEKTLSFARQSVFNDRPAIAKITNTPKMLSRTSALSGVLDDVDCLESECGDDDGQRSVNLVSVPTLSRSLSLCNASSVGLSVPKPPDANQEEDALKTVSGRQSTESLLNSFKPVQPQADAKAKAKAAKAKPKSKQASKRPPQESDPQPADDSKRPRLITSMEPPKLPHGKGAASASSLAVTGVTDAINAADKKWYDETQQAMSKVMCVFPAEESDLKKLWQQATRIWPACCLASEHAYVLCDVGSQKTERFR